MEEDIKFPPIIPPNGDDLFSPAFRGTEEIYEAGRIPAELLVPKEIRTATALKAAQPDIDWEKLSYEGCCHFILENYWGYKDFRPGQMETMLPILTGRDSLLIMPTGAGKSLVYQIPALYFHKASVGTAIVVSPLIALMKDQVDALKEINIPAEYLNSSLSVRESNEVLARFAGGELALLYVAPERFKNSSFMEILSKSIRRGGSAKLSFLAIDEAHCISTWGHDFRPDFRRLGELREVLDTHVFATTATATVQVQDDIVKQLNMKDPYRKVTGFDRPNLTFEVEHFPSEIARDRAFEKLIAEILEGAVEKGFVPPLIVYCGTRKSTDAISKWINTIAQEEGFTGTLITPYHAGLKDSVRDAVQDDFMSGRLPWVAATCAFGMGVDKSDIRYVIHYAIPGSVESYYQEVGRAGRDGDDSRTLMYVCRKDESLQWFFIEMANPPQRVIQNVYDVLWQFKEPILRMTYDDVYCQYREWYGRDDHQSLVDTSIRLLKKFGAFDIGSPRGQIWMGTEKKLDDLGELFDWEALKKKRTRDSARFRAMMSFVRSREDKRKLLLHYFGEIR